MNTTRLDPDKVASVARIAQYCIRNANEIPDKVITQQIIKEGIRKIHDAAQSSRGRGKYLGHEPWSENGLKLLSDNGGLIRAITKHLTHEHVVPVQIQIEELFRLPSNADLSAFEKCIRDYSVIAIITREEDELLRKSELGNRMPDDWDHSDPWARYKMAGIYERIVIA